MTIVDRYSRFAKIGGEMVSLGAIESALSPLLPEDSEVTATAIADSKKGEQVVLLYAGELSDTELQGLIAGSGLTALMQPSAVVRVEEIPKLGSGKTDFAAAKQLALAGNVD